MPPAMKLLDADGDGELSASEIENSSAVLAELDTDFNGRLSKDEMKPKPPKGDEEERRRPRRERDEEGEEGEHPVMEALDQNGDETISKRELARAAKSLLELDQDESGALEREEMKPEEHREGGGSGEGGGDRPPRPPRPPRR